MLNLDDLCVLSSLLNDTIKEEKEKGWNVSEYETLRNKINNLLEEMGQ